MGLINQYAAARFLLAVFAAAFLGGCAAVVVGGAAVIASDRRTTGTVLDDQTMEIQVVDHIYSAVDIDESDHVKVEVYQGVVLLVGEVQNESNRKLAGERAAEVEHVGRVVNELEVAGSATTSERLDNTWLTTKVNAALVKENPVHGFDATRVKVVSSRNNVYLMGLVSRAEGDAAAEVARNVSGVAKVVKVFSYTD
ncbi:MAG: BON domain-containing protein [Xanthomonadales bacterium]|nr:BON domain-containing protein [Xanthomonadales bacterium]NIX13258.1 BON domain-containing protein [Xanthomonadales bacterium]